VAAWILAGAKEAEVLPLVAATKGRRLAARAQEEIMRAKSERALKEATRGKVPSFFHDGDDDN